MNQVTSTGEPADQHDSTAPTTAIGHSDTTIAPVTSTGEPAAQAMTFDGADRSDCPFGYDHRARHVDRRAGRSGEPGHVDRRAGRSA